MSDNRKTILITGCNAPGIGHYLALEFKKYGLRVMATARNTDSIQDLAAKGIETFPLTVNDHESVKSLYVQVKEALREEGRGLDYLYNNAGMNYTVPGLDVDIDEVEDMFNVNLFAVMNMNKVFAPLVLQAGGTFVHTGSVAGIMPFFYGSAYNASKAALRSYCDTLRVEIAPLGVHVINVITGGVKSNIARTHRTLPEQSIMRLAGAETAYTRRLTTSQTMGIDANLYVKDVVPKVLNSRGYFWSTNEIWAGGSASAIYVAHILDIFWPGGLFKYFMHRIGAPSRLDKISISKLQNM